MRSELRADEKISSSDIEEQSDSLIITSSEILIDTLTPPKVAGSGLETSNPFDISKHSEAAGISAGPSVRAVQKPSSSLSQDTKVIVLVYSLVMLIILTLAISMDRKRFGNILQACINSNHLRTLYRENQAWTNGQDIILYAFFFLNLAFVIWFFDVKLNQAASFNLFWIVGGVIVCYMIRHVVMWSISSIFPLGQEVGLHNYSISLHNIVLGVFLLPFIIALEFLPGVSYQSLLYGVFGLALVIYALRQFKGFLLSIGMRGFNPFYFFIYLCAIEIAPMLVGYKMMIGAL